ncbi:hypothetical protein LTS17_004787 [Exophiala oligosperma]
MPRTSHNDPAGSAAVACIECRRLKMRCLGAANPPCRRCEKAGKSCVVRASRRGARPQSIRTSNAEEPRDSVFNAVEPMIRSPASQVHDDGPQPASHNDMVTPGGLGSSPFLPLAQSPFDALGSAVGETFPVTQLSSSSNVDASVHPHHQPLPRSNITEQTLVELLHFFRVNLKYCVPVIDDSDFDEPVAVVRNRQCLAYCASYVASRFAVGCARLRAPLLARVTEFIVLAKRRIPADQDQLWTELQAFAILYAYQPATDIFHLPELHKDELSHWELKSFVESFAFRAGLHRSIERVRPLLRENATSSMAGSSPFQHYIYWLWLFTMSHHFSLMTRTPPSIRADLTITTATELLSEIPKPSRVTRIVAEIDLYMLWSHAGRYVPELAEWWCTPSFATDIVNISDIYEDIAAALELWSQRWGLRGEAFATVSDLDVTRNATVEFHLRATRFTIGSFITRWNLRRITNAHKAMQFELTDVALKSLLSTIQNACDVFQPYLNMSPLRREKLRYMPDYAFALIAFCCLYILNAIDLFGASIAEHAAYLDIVHDTAIFLQEMGIANSTNPPRYGAILLDSLRSMRTSPRPGSEQVTDSIQTWLHDALSEPQHATEGSLHMRHMFC